MPDEPLTPATADEVLLALAYGLTHKANGRPHRQAQDSMARMAAETLALHLERSGFVVMKRQAAKAHSTPKG